jgi:hypothetical protein
MSRRQFTAAVFANGHPKCPFRGTSSIGASLRDTEAETKPLNLPDGQITSTSRINEPSSPSHENIALAPSGKSVI